MKIQLHLNQFFSSFRSALLIGVSAALFLPFLDPCLAGLANDHETKYEEQFEKAVNYGAKPGKETEEKEAAIQFFIDQGDEGIRFFISKLHIKNVIIRVTLEKILKSIGTDAVPGLIEGLQNENDRTRRLLVRFLGDSKDRRAVPPLLELLRQDAELQSYIFQSLGDLKAEEAVPVLVQGLNAEKEADRIYAAVALGHIKSQNAVTELIQTLSDPVFTVRNAAAEALIETGKPGEKQMVKALKTAEGYLELHLVEILGRMKSKKALKLLRKKLNSDDWLLQGLAIEAVGNINPGKATKSVKKLNVDKLHPFVQNKIKNIGG